MSEIQRRQDVNDRIQHELEIIAHPESDVLETD